MSTAENEYPRANSVLEISSACSVIHFVVSDNMTILEHYSETSSSVLYVKALRYSTWGNGSESGAAVAGNQRQGKRGEERIREERKRREKREIYLPELKVLDNSTAWEQTHIIYQIKVLKFKIVEDIFLK